MKAIQIIIFAVSAISAFCLSSKMNFRMKPKMNKKIIHVPTEEFEYVEETWDDGEVAWELEPYYKLKNNTRVVLVKTHEPIIISNREKLWGLVEELRIQGALSGFLNVAYYNTAVSDNIVNDIQNYQVKANMNLENIIIYNFSNEIDIILTLLTIYGYRKYKESRIVEFIHYWEEKYKNNYYLEEYRNIRKISTSAALIGLIIFCKSVRSAS
jgi:hypothetical protein